MLWREGRTMMSYSHSGSAVSRSLQRPKLIAMFLAQELLRYLDGPFDQL